jgi:hypothetical protein
MVSSYLIPGHRPGLPDLSTGVEVTFVITNKDKCHCRGNDKPFTIIQVEAEQFNKELSAWL